MQSLKEKLSFCFKYDMRNLRNFHPTTQKSENFTPMSYFCPKYMRFELKKKKERSYLSCHWTVMQNLRNPDIVVSKMAWRIGWTFIIRAPKSLKIVHWWAVFVQSIYCFRKFQRNYVSWHWRVLQSLNENWLVGWKVT